jgi:hypothetical protein
VHPSPPPPRRAQWCPAPVGVWRGCGGVGHVVGQGGARMGWGGRAEPMQYQWHWQGTGRNIGAHHTPLFTGSAVPCRAVPALALGKPASTLNCACGRCQGKGVGPGPLLVPSLEGGVEVCHCHCHWHTGRARCMRVCGVARPAVTVARVLAARDAVRGVWVGRVVA